MKGVCPFSLADKSDEFLSVSMGGDCGRCGCVTENVLEGKSAAMEKYEQTFTAFKNSCILITYSHLSKGNYISK